MHVVGDTIIPSQNLTCVYSLNVQPGVCLSIFNFIPLENYPITYVSAITVDLSLTMNHGSCQSGFVPAYASTVQQVSYALDTPAPVEIYFNAGVFAKSGDVEIHAKSVCVTILLRSY